MQGDGKKRLWTLPLLLGAGLMASAVAEENAERSKEGFIEGSEVNLLLRNFYFNRDFRKGQSSPAGGGYTEEWVQGFMANFSSGFTQGTLGVGIDAFAQLGVRLDSGGGRSGAGGSVDLLPYDDQGRPQVDYSRAGGAVKLRWYGTVLRVGDVFPETPVIQYGNSRLFPSSFRGFTLVNDSLAKGLTLQAGKLNSMTQPNSTSGSDDFYSFYTGRRIDSPWVAYAGGDYQATEHWSVSLYGSRQKDAWDQYYAGTSFNYPLDDKLSLLGGANYYKVKDQGRQVMGELDNDIWSVRGGFAYGPHQVLLSYQRNNGDDDFDYLRQTDSIYLDNSIQYSDFNSPKERSLMLRYDLDMARLRRAGAELHDPLWQGLGRRLFECQQRLHAHRRQRQPADQPGPLGTRRGGQVRGAGWRGQGPGVPRAPGHRALRQLRVGPRRSPPDRRIPAASPLKARRRPVRGGALRQPVAGGCAAALLLSSG